MMLGSFRCCGRSVESSMKPTSSELTCGFSIWSLDSNEDRPCSPTCSGFFMPGGNGIPIREYPSTAAGSRPLALLYYLFSKLLFAVDQCQYEMLRSWNSLQWWISRWRQVNYNIVISTNYFKKFYTIFGVDLLIISTRLLIFDPPPSL